MARQLAAGRYNFPFFHLYRALEDGQEPPEQKLAVAEEPRTMPPAVPDQAAAWRLVDPLPA